MAKGLTADELRTEPEDVLVTKLKEAKEELFNLRFQAATGQLESHGRLRAVKREIARIYTVMRERELGIITFVEEEVPVETADAEPVTAETSEQTGEETEDEVSDEAPKKTPRKRASKAAKASEETDG